MAAPTVRPKRCCEGPKEVWPRPATIPPLSASTVSLARLVLSHLLLRAVLLLLSPQALSLRPMISGIVRPHAVQVPALAMGPQPALLPLRIERLPVRLVC